jgi:hypothetical protein
MHEGMIGRFNWICFNLNEISEEIDFFKIFDSGDGFILSFHLY